MNLHGQGGSRRLSSRWALRASIVFAALGIAACDGDLGLQPLGSMGLTTSASSELVTADGWNVKVQRFLVHVSAVSVAGADGLSGASSEAQIVNPLAPEVKALLSAPNRTARAWEDVRIQIGPAIPGGEVTLVGATDADREALQSEGFSLYVEATVARGDITKSLAWGFTTDTLYKDCEGGLVVPPGGNDTVDVVLGADVLFSDDLAAPGTTMRADAIVLGDVDNDGSVTLDELRSVPLDAARTHGGAYGTAEKPHVADLGAFVEELTRSAVRRFRAGSCVSEPYAL